MTLAPTVPDRAAGRWLVAAAIAYSVLHHLGTFVSPLGDVGDGPTR